MHLYLIFSPLAFLWLDVDGSFQACLSMSFHIQIELFLRKSRKHGRQDFALALVPKVKSGEQQAQYYQQMGLHDQAQRARQGQERSGAGRLLNILGVGR